MLSVVLYGCESLSFTLKGGKNTGMLKKKKKKEWKKKNMRRK
jgi:hypothetical protein